MAHSCKRQKNILIKNLTICKNALIYSKITVKIPIAKMRCLYYTKGNLNIYCMVRYNFFLWKRELYLSVRNIKGLIKINNAVY